MADVLNDPDPARAGGRRATRDGSRARHEEVRHEEVGIAAPRAAIDGA
ncbi:hypothetical protein [Streptomyces sp. NPDC101393]